MTINHDYMPNVYNCAMERARLIWLDLDFDPSEEDIARAKREEESAQGMLKSAFWPWNYDLIPF